MTTATQLVGAHVEAPQFEILRAASVTLNVTDLAASEHFYTELLGMIATEYGHNCVYLRGWEEHHHHSLVLQQSEKASVEQLSFRMAGADQLELLKSDLLTRGMSAQEVHAPRAGVGTVIRTFDQLGYPLEFFYEIDSVPAQRQRFDLQRGAPLLRFDHISLHTPRLEESFVFWRSMGFRCSEFIAADDDSSLVGAWLFRKPSVHDVSLMAGQGPRLHHFAYRVGESADVIKTCDQIAAAGCAQMIERGPGRHGVSNAFFVYLRDPDGHRIELYAGDYYTGDPDLTPLRWSASDPRCRSFWGTAVPDSWYEQSSSVLGVDGFPLPLLESDLGQCEYRSEVMS